MGKDSRLTKPSLPGWCRCSRSNPCLVLADLLADMEACGESFEDLLDSLDPVKHRMLPVVLKRDGEPAYPERSCGWLREWWWQHNFPYDKWPSRRDEYYQHKEIYDKAFKEWLTANPEMAKKYENQEEDDE